MGCGPWVGLTSAIGVVPFPRCGGVLGFGFEWFTTGHLRQRALVSVETKAPLDGAELWWLWVPWQQ